MLPIETHYDILKAVVYSLNETTAVGIRYTVNTSFKDDSYEMLAIWLGITVYYNCGDGERPVKYEQIWNYSNCDVSAAFVADYGRRTLYELAKRAAATERMYFFGKYDSKPFCEI